MPKVLALKDGRCETLFTVRDFEELIERYMGYESVQHFRELVSENEDALDELRAEYEEKIDRLKEKYRELQEKMEEKDCERKS